MKNIAETNFKIKEKTNEEIKKETSEENQFKIKNNKNVAADIKEEISIAIHNGTKLNNERKLEV